MKKNYFWVLLLLLLLSAVVFPTLKKQEKTIAQKPQPTIPPFEAGADVENCSQQLAQKNSDDLSLLTNQKQDSKVNDCLFLGCNGFF